MKNYSNLKCLSVRQPWAWLICAGIKDVENRDWRGFYTGPLLIHASKTVEETDLYWLKQEGHPIPDDLARGAIIGAAVLTHCTDEISSKWHNWGCFGFYLRNQILFDTPVPWRGQLGFFDVSLTDVPEAHEWLERLEVRP
jgi:hypothetical protein